MVSAEWAVGIIAAIGMAGVLIAVITNGAVQDALLKFILQLIHSFSGSSSGAEPCPKRCPAPAGLRTGGW